jgi:hypothetical protein
VKTISNSAIPQTHRTPWLRRAHRKSAGRRLLGEPGQNRGGRAIEQSFVPVQ